MTNASAGMATALARAGGSVIAIGEMSAVDLLASMSAEQKAAVFAAAPAPATAGVAVAAMEPGDDTGDEKCSKCSEPMKDGKCKKCSPDSNASAALIDGTPLQTNASIHERVKAVASAVEADDNCKGKAGLALAMLADDDYASLSASGIVKLLGKTPATAAAADADGEAGAGMLAAMKAMGNANTGNSSASVSAEANHGWDSIHADIQARRGK